MTIVCTYFVSTVRYDRVVGSIGDPLQGGSGAVDTEIGS